jgi:hypothetical protein
MIEPTLRFQVEPGTRPRLVVVRIARDATATADPGLLLDAFVRGVLAGCLGLVPPGTTILPEPLVPPSPDEVAFRLPLPPLPEGALQVLGNMAVASVYLDSGITRLVVEEQVDPPPAPRTTLGLASLTPPIAPFPVPRFEAALLKRCGLLATFQCALGEPEVERVASAARAWEGLTLGGFPAPLGLSMTRILDVAPHLDDEIVIRLEFFAGGAEAWHAIVRAFEQIHRDVAPVRSLEML